MDRLKEIIEALEHIGDVSDEDLASYRQELTDTYRELRDGELSEDVVNDLQSIADTLAKIQEEDNARTEAQTALAEQLSNLDAAVLAEDESAEDEDEAEEVPAEEVAEDEPEAEAEVEAEPEAVMASVARAAERLSKAHRPRVPASPKKEMTILDLAKAAEDKWHSMTRHDGQRVNFAKLFAHYDDSRTLGASFEDNLRKIQAVNTPEAITAAGGVCAPATPRYDLPMDSVALRPVRDTALVPFNADRGGSVTITAPTLAGVGTSGGGSSQAVDEITNAEDASSTTKPYQAISCPTTTTTRVSAITDHFQFGELQARYHPELVATWLGLGLAAHARTAENAILTAIGSGSVAVTENRTFGASRDILRYLNREAAQMRSRHRMAPTAPIRVILPYWFVRVFQNDVANGQFPIVPDGADQAFLEARLRKLNINVTWHLDGVGSGPQVAATQNAGTLNGWGTVLRWYMFPEGSWIFLDGGELSLDVIRDSTLVAGNNFRTFYESFENVAFVGVESHVMTATFCESGESAGTVSADFCTTGS